MNERKLPKLKSRKKDAIETEEKCEDGKVFRPQQHGSEAVKVSDTVEEEGSSSLVVTTCFPCSAVKELCCLLHNDLARLTLRSHVLSDDAQVLTTLHCYSTGSFQWFVGRGTGLSQPVIDGVIQALYKLSNVAIIFTTSQQQLTANKLAFHNIAGLPSTAHMSQSKRQLSQKTPLSIEKACTHGTSRVPVM